MDSVLLSTARRTLLEWRGGAPGWRYRAAGEPYVEPTALALLALASAADDDDRAVREHIASAADWLATLQQPDGSLGLSPALPAPHWTTSLTLLAWQAANRHESPRRRALDWLTLHRGERLERTPGSPFGHDPTLQGWSWVQGTHSWLEPTAISVLGLARETAADSAYVDEGRRLIRDRAVRTGGWNYGNSRAFDTDLRPQPGPTGLALLALAGVDDADTPHIDRGCRFLEQVLPTTRAAQSLCWGLLGLAAWRRRPADADSWLAAALERAPRRSDRAVQLAYTLLAAGDGALSILLRES